MGTIVVLILGGILLYVLFSGTARSGKHHPEQARLQSNRRGSGSRPSPRLEFSVEVSSGDGYRIRRERPRQRPPSELAQAGDRCWIPPDKDVTIAGSVIRDGMVY